MMCLQNKIKLMSKKTKTIYSSMQNSYINDLRNNSFMYVVKHIYCASMNIPFFNNILQLCDHISNNKPIEHEVMLSMEFVITQLDSLMNYTNNEPTTESIKQSKFFKTNSTQNDKRKSWMFMLNKHFNLRENVKKPSSIHITKATSSNIQTSNKLSEENVELSLKRKDVAEKDFDVNIQTKRLKNLVVDNNKEEVELSLKRKGVSEEEFNEHIQAKRLNNFVLENNKGEVSNLKNENNVTSVESDIGRISFINPEDHINQIFQTINIQMEYISSDEENVDSCEMSVSSTNNEKIGHTNESTSILKHNIEKSYSTKISDATKTKILKNMYYRNSKGETQLHVACSQGSLDLIQMLLSEGFNPNVKDNAGWTPLHEAVKIGHLDIVKMLIQDGAYLNVPGFEYETPLFTAIKYDHVDIAKILLQYGADRNSINIFGKNVQHVNMELWLELMKCKIPYTPLQIQKNKFKPNKIVIFLDNIILNNALISTFCKQFNAKIVKNILNDKELGQVTHIIVSKTKDNICNENMECLIGIANGIFIVNQNWIHDSVKNMTLRPCENYEVNGTASFIDSNGPHLSRINKQNLYPKLFDNINIHLFGNVGWKQYSLEQLKKLIHEFGAKLLKRMPNPEDCPSTIKPYHCHNSELMSHVSNIILFTKDSNSLIKYNMKHLKVFHISWFIEAIQKHSII